MDLANMVAMLIHVLTPSFGTKPWYRKIRKVDEICGPQIQHGVFHGHHSSTPEPPEMENQ